MLHVQSLPIPQSSVSLLLSRNFIVHILPLGLWSILIQFFCENCLDARFCRWIHSSFSITCWNSNVSPCSAVAPLSNDQFYMGLLWSHCSLRHLFFHQSTLLTGLYSKVGHCYFNIVLLLQYSIGCSGLFVNIYKITWWWDCTECSYQWLDQSGAYNKKEALLVKF